MYYAPNGDYFVPSNIFSPFRLRIEKLLFIFVCFAEHSEEKSRNDEVISCEIIARNRKLLGAVFEFIY